MVKKVLILIASFASIITNAQQPPALKPWVRNATMVYMRMYKNYWQISIEETTTIATLKRKIQSSDGISAENQDIMPFWKKWWTLWLAEGHGPSLDNNQSVKQIMNDYNTNCFEVQNKNEAKKLNK